MAAPRKPLRAVAPDEVAQPPQAPLTVAEAAEVGHRDLLVAMRTRIAKAVSDPKCPPRDLASLTRRLDDIAEKIVALDARAAEEDTSGDAVEDEAFDSSAV